MPNHSVTMQNASTMSLQDRKKDLYIYYGYDALLSDQIPFNRSVPDIRPEMCKNTTYEAELPKVAIIIIFYNERLSVLLRTVYSILNRTPGELLQEIILVDDGSTEPDVKAPLLEYLNVYLPPKLSKVHLLRLSARGGLMVARMSGARAASHKSEVLIFLDSHFEAMFDWLPPLLAPIAHNPKACTCPLIDKLKFDTFKYERLPHSRGYFNWNLRYFWKYIYGNENPEGNYREYVMPGGAMAIRADFFWQLGGFDDGMQFWGGEQFEISFKIWMCGGELINVPCSRLGHIYRDPNSNTSTILYKDYSFINLNFRRLIDVWMDEEHRKYVINNRPSIVNTDPGDLTERLAIRDRLQCKSFTWMLNNIMPDIKYYFPTVDRPDIGNGVIRSANDSTLCIQLDAKKYAVLRACNASKNSQQIWRYTRFGSLRLLDSCLDSEVKTNRVSGNPCDNGGGNQKWYYNPEQKWLSQSYSKLCMVANVAKHIVELAPCIAKNSTMEWSISYLNDTAMNTLKDFFKVLF